MPSVDKVELDGHHVTDARRSSVRVIDLRGLESRIQSPGSIDTVEVDNHPEVIVEDVVDIETASYQACRLEEILILLLEGLCFPRSLVITDPGMIELDSEAVILVDQFQPETKLAEVALRKRMVNLLLRNMVVEAVEHDQEHTYTRRESEKPLLGETIGLQLSVLERAHSVLHLLVVTIQRRQIEVGRCIRNVRILTISPEEIYYKSAPTVLWT